MACSNCHCNGRGWQHDDAGTGTILLCYCGCHDRPDAAKPAVTSHVEGTLQANAAYLGQLANRAREVAVASREERGADHPVTAVLYRRASILRGACDDLRAALRAYATASALLGYETRPLTDDPST